MKWIALLLAVPMVASVVAAQSAKEVSGATPYAEIKDEPPAKLIVDPPLPDLLSHTPSVVWIQWRVERAYRTGVRKGSPQRISAGRASAHPSGRCALVVGGRE